MASRRELICSLLAAGVQLLPVVNSAEQEEKLETKLLGTLKEFAKANRLSDERLQSLVGGLVLNSKAIAKKGVGSIGHETYLLLDSPQNSISIGGTDWKGARATDGEAVIVGEHGVLGSVNVKDESHLTMVLFTPSGVRYIDLSKNTGARFDRSLTPISK